MIPVGWREGDPDEEPEEEVKEEEPDDDYLEGNVF